MGLPKYITKAKTLSLSHCISRQAEENEITIATYDKGIVSMQVMTKDNSVITTTEFTSCQAEILVELLRKAIRKSQTSHKQASQ